jgi:LysM repeat protein
VAESKIGDVLTRKVGPLPGWAWVGVAAVGGYIYVRYRAANPSTDDDGTDTETPAGTDLSNTGADLPPQDFAAPYTGAGVYTALASAQAGEQADTAKLTADRKELATVRSSNAVGNVNPTTKVFTARFATTLQDVARRFGVTVGQLRRDNPHLKTGSKVAKGERLHITAPKRSTPRPATAGASS